MTTSYMKSRSRKLAPLQCKVCETIISNNNDDMKKFLTYQSAEILILWSESHTEAVSPTETGPRNKQVTKMINKLPHK